MSECQSWHSIKWPGHSVTWSVTLTPRHLPWGLGGDGETVGFPCQQTPPPPVLDQWHGRGSGHYNRTCFESWAGVSTHNWPTETYCGLGMFLRVMRQGLPSGFFSPAQFYVFSVFLYFSARLLILFFCLGGWPHRHTSLQHIPTFSVPFGVFWSGAVLF